MIQKVSLKVIVIYVNNNTIIIIIVTDDEGNNWVKIGCTQLTRKHKDDLLGGKWLNDSHIHAVQQLIKLDPDLQHIRGLQNPILGQSLRFDVVREEMVQMIEYANVQVNINVKN